MNEQSGVPKELWDEAILYTNYGLNRVKLANLENKTPAEIWYKRYQM